MASHVALLRAVNVGGATKLPMADLRAAMTSLGFTEVATYIQSGNAIFTPSRPAPAPTLARRIEDALEEHAGKRPPVVVLTAEELRAVAAACPYDGLADPKRVHVTFGVSASADAVRDAVDRARAKGGRDEAEVGDGVVYLHTPDGLGRSKLAESLARGVAKSGTTRNFSTVTKLLQLVSDDRSAS